LATKLIGLSATALTYRFGEFNFNSEPISKTQVELVENARVQSQSDKIVLVKSGDGSTPSGRPGALPGGSFPKANTPRSFNVNPYRTAPPLVTDNPGNPTEFDDDVCSIDDAKKLEEKL
jgi:hypothetical protein